MVSIPKCHLFETYRCLAQTSDRIQKLRQPSVGVLGSVQVSSTRFEKTTTDIDVRATEIIATPLDTSESNDGRCNTHFCQLPHVSRGFESCLNTLVFLKLRLPVKLLLQFFHERRCYVWPDTIQYGYCAKL
jgi:hypothetical protein